MYFIRYRGYFKVNLKIVEDVSGRIKMYDHWILQIKFVNT